MNKNDLIDAIAAEADLSKASAGRALDAALGAITSALSKQETVSLVGFGTFSGIFDITNLLFCYSFIWHILLHNAQEDAFRYPMG